MLCPHTLPGFQVLKSFIQFLTTHIHKPIFYLSNNYYGFYVISIIWSGYQIEYYTTCNFLECHQDADHVGIINRWKYVSGIIHTLLGVSVCWKIKINNSVSSYSTYGETHCLYKAVKNTKYFQCYTDSIFLHAVSPTVHQKNNTSCISLVDAKIVTSGVF